MRETQILNTCVWAACVLCALCVCGREGAQFIGVVCVGGTFLCECLWEAHSFFFFVGEVFFCVLK